MGDIGCGGCLQVACVCDVLSPAPADSPPGVREEAKDALREKFFSLPFGTPSWTDLTDAVLAVVAKHLEAALETRGAERALKLRALLAELKGTR